MIFVTMDAKTPPDALTDARAPGSGAARSGRVLVLDDEVLVGKSLGRLLSGAHEVTVLTSPLEALRRFEAGERWDVVLCDLMMPELSGMELEPRLAALEPRLVGADHDSRVQARRDV